MGVIKRGILGGFSGKVAGVVGGSWKGIAVMKALPLSVANPKTADQMAQRNKFSQCVKAASKLLVDVCKGYWDRSAQFMSGYNAFTKQNIDNFDASGVSNLAGLVMSPGSLPETVISSTVLTAGLTTITVNWVDDSGQGEKLDSDIPTVVVYHEDGNIFFSKESAVEDRTAELVSIPVSPALVAGEKWSAWLLFQGAKKVVKFKAGSDLSGTVQ